VSKGIPVDLSGHIGQSWRECPHIVHSEQCDLFLFGRSALEAF
jgi:hypothetical protein